MFLKIIILTINKRNRKQAKEGQRCPTKIGVLKQKLVISSSDSDPDEWDSLKCGVCNMRYYFAQSTMKEDWICCQLCKTWYHEICVGFKVNSN